MTRSILAVFLLVLAHPALAQVNPAFADVNDEIEMVRSLVRMERKAAVEQAMGLTPAESQAFCQGAAANAGGPILPDRA